MWSYQQASGWLTDKNGNKLAEGYSGANVGKNNPESQHVPDIGPIPRGKYSIGTPIDTVTHGPYVMQLSPYPDNQMFGRSGFLIHGDSVVNPGTASKGCVIMPRFARETIWRSGDHELQVTA